MENMFGENSRPKPEIDPIEADLGRRIEEAEVAMREAMADLDLANRELMEHWTEYQKLVAAGEPVEETRRLLHEMEFLVSDLTDTVHELEEVYERLREMRREYLQRKSEKEGLQ